MKRLRVISAHLALGAEVLTVIRASETEAFLKDQALDEEVIAQAAQLIKKSRAITDIRFMADYRNEMAGVILTRGVDNISEQG